MSTQPAPVLDIVEMPLEGLAAYWLSLKKIMGVKFQPKALLEEAGRTEEPYIRYLLELVVSGLSEEDILRLGAVRRDTVLRGVSLKMTLIRQALLSISANENPRKALVRLAALVPEPPLGEDVVTKSAMTMLKRAGVGDKDYTVSISMDLPPDQLVLKLMFYVLMARREGAGELEPYAEQSPSRYFKDGLAMVSDGFDRSFIKTCLDSGEEAYIAMGTHKMNTAMELAALLRIKMAYEDMFKAAQAYL